ncbi:MAG: MBL fold metallo-hydrolase [Bacteroidales bacterium]|jgi:glyoxylase-like metal-dependent hydrolase (beta-lactamase superfamily II)|nr:MBL fold metallo-hydrolase [Bacteroidales bacterium]
MKIHHMVFNPYEVNTYILSDAEKQCIIIDPACHSPKEQDILKAYIEDSALTPVWLINTHGHFDHIIGNAFVCKTWQVKVAAHRNDLFLLEHAWKQGEVFGFPVEQPPLPTVFFEEGDELNMNGIHIKIYHIPGHSPGSIILYAPDEKTVFVGDVLFSGSIGRTDLPGGDFDQLIDGITRKLLTLPSSTVVCSGHGPQTSIGREMSHNPFLKGL